MSDAQLQELARADRYRYAELAKGWERANNDFIAAKY
jgi:hypothetical protein